MSIATLNSPDGKKFLTHRVKKGSADRVEAAQPKKNLVGRSLTPSLPNHFGAKKIVLKLRLPQVLLMAFRDFPESICRLSKLIASD